jgi:hypothetical protein
LRCFHKISVAAQKSGDRRGFEALSGAGFGGSWFRGGADGSFFHVFGG